MSSTAPPGKRNSAPSELPLSPTDAQAFAEVIAMIQSSRGRAFAAVNTTLVELYLQLGEYISRKIEAASWGDGVVEQLARFIKKNDPNLTGFTKRNLFRMRQFYETYQGDIKVSALLTQLPWTHHLLILGQCKRSEEREFYIRLAVKEKWSSRELERQLNSALFERTIVNPPKVSTALKEHHPGAELLFRDMYLVDFLALPQEYKEIDLHKGLLANLKNFLSELGRDFCFIGSEVSLQIGGRDFFTDLLFFHRGLNCLVVFELKIGEFQPEHLGKLEFYLEALDREVRKEHEGPSIGVLLCADKDSEVVEYALSRAMSPALVAEYQTKLPDKKMLQAKLHEFYEFTQHAVNEAAE